MKEIDALKLFKKAVAAAGGQRAFARAVGFSAPYINDIYHGRRAIAAPILKRLGLKVVVSVEYQEKKSVDALAGVEDLNEK